MLNISTNKKVAAVAALAVVPTTLAMGGIMTPSSASALTYTIPNGYTTITDANFYDCVASNFVRDFPSEEIPATGLTDAQLAKMDRLYCLDGFNVELASLYYSGSGFIIDQAFIEEYHIANTKGLEKMSNLVEVALVNVGDKVDVSHNTKLEYLTIVSKELTSLDVSHNTKLRDLEIVNGTLGGIENIQERVEDIDPNDGTINRGKLANLDVSHNKELTGLVVSASSLADIDISQNTKLIWLSMPGNSIFNLSSIESAISSNDNLDDYVFLYRQEKTIETHSTTYELPPIFTQIKAEQWGESQFELENATLSSDGKSITITDKTKPASIKIAGGQADGTILTVVYAEVPTPENNESASEDTEVTPKDDKTTPKDTESAQEDAKSPEVRTPNTGFTTDIESGSDELNLAAIICALAFATAVLSYGVIRTLSRKKIFRA